VQGADALSPASALPRALQDAAVEFARADVFATGRAADIWAVTPSALQTELLALWLPKPPLHRAARVPYSHSDSVPLRHKISDINVRISSVNDRLQAIGAPAGGAAGSAPKIDLVSIWVAFAQGMPHKLIELHSWKSLDVLIEQLLDKPSLGLHELMTEIDKRFTDSIYSLLTCRKERKDESIEAAQRIMHRYNGVMPKVFAAAGEAFAEWARTCEAQAAMLYRG